MSQTSDDSADEYWASSSTQGFDFDSESEWASTGNLKLASIKKPDLNKSDLTQLSCGGLSEIAENETLVSDELAEDFATYEERQAEKIAKSCNPLDISFKVNNTDQQLTASQTIRNLILGSDCSFKHFKSKFEKQELLQAAVESHDGNAILTVVMFLKSTLKKSLFQREIGRFPDAVNTYLINLLEEHEMDELTNMLLLLDMPNETAVLKYSTVFPVKSRDRKYQLVENCLNTHFQKGVVKPRLRESILEHKMCLEDQSVLEDHKISIGEQDSRSDIFSLLTGDKELFDSSVMGSFIFAVINFYDVPKIAPVSPVSIAKNYDLSQKQYTWGVLRALAAGKRWTELEQFFISKKWLRGSTMKSVIGFESVLEVLWKEIAPQEIMDKYVCCIEEPDVKLAAAKKYKCHSVVVEILKKNRDRLGLIQYKEYLEPESLVFRSIVSILKSEPINWKN